MEPRYPNAEALSRFGERAHEPTEHDGARLRNSFWSWRWRTRVLIWQEADGRIQWGKVPRAHGFGFLLSTLSAAKVWGIEQEARAVHTLGTLLRHHQFKDYMLTGCFAERSRRSGLLYFFRRLRPTVAVSTRPDRKHAEPRIIATLCLHPIAYYENSWAGAMAPTDDVIAHLMLMRGDEPMFWRRAQQHAPFEHESGL